MVIDDKDKDNYDITPVNIVFWITVIAVVVSLFYVVEVITVAEAKVPAPCILIKSNTPLPDGVITKGYDVIRTPVGDVYDNPADSVNIPDVITYECFYIKDAGVIERTIYQWDLYQ